MANRMVSARQLVGRKIVGFTCDVSRDATGRLAHTPRVVLDDGSVLLFSVEETDEGGGHSPPSGYGVLISKVSK